MCSPENAPDFAKPEARLRYGTSHWAREGDQAMALDAYLALGAKVYNRTKFRLFMDLAGDVRGKTILDFGGGAGIVAIPYAKAGANVVLVDAEANALKTAEFYAAREGVTERVRIVQADAFPQSLKTQRFDIVIAKDIIEHVPEDEELLRELSSCQSAGGILLLCTQNNRSLNYLIEGSYQKYWCGNRNWLGWDTTHVRFYNAPTLRRKLTAVGYRSDRWASVFLVPYNILSWLFLGRVKVELPILHHVDLSLGRLFPFNRLGWNIIVRGSKR